MFFDPQRFLVQTIKNYSILKVYFKNFDSGQNFTNWLNKSKELINSKAENNSFQNCLNPLIKKNNELIILIIPYSANITGME